MFRRLITYSLPAESPNQARIYRTITEQDSPSPYETIDFLLENIESLDDLKIEQVNDPEPIGEVLTIHNATGMRDIAQMQTMIEKVKRGDHVFNSNSLPNVKIVLAPDKRYLMFDGHHTALAYLLAGKKFLHEMPHIVISNQNQPLSAEEISYFFPEDKRELVQEDWLKYTVNWQNPDEKIELRQIQTIGDLLKAIRERA